MSSGAIGIIGSVATGQSVARNAEIDRVARDGANQARHAASNDLAEKASGIGQTEKENEASDRDADGRRPWEFADKQQSPAEADETSSAPPSKDPSGAAGSQLDLSG